jgi:hypothetical protein
MPTAQYAAQLGPLREIAGATAPLVPDAHVAVLALEHHRILSSSNQDVAHFPGLCCEHLPVDSPPAACARCRHGGETPLEATGKPFADLRCLSPLSERTSPPHTAVWQRSHAVHADTCRTSPVFQTGSKDMVRQDGVSGDPCIDLRSRRVTPQPAVRASPCAGVGAKAAQRAASPHRYGA